MFRYFFPLISSSIISFWLKIFVSLLTSLSGSSFYTFSQFPWCCQICLQKILPNATTALCLTPLSDPFYKRHTLYNFNSRTYNFPQLVPFYFPSDFYKFLTTLLSSESSENLPDSSVILGFACLPPFKPASDATSSPSLLNYSKLIFPFSFSDFL